jgi:hypothetical protein
LPPHITFQQAKGMFSALAHRDPDTRGIVEQSIKSVAEEFLPHGNRER